MVHVWQCDVSEPLISPYFISNYWIVKTEKLTTKPCLYVKTKILTNPLMFSLLSSGEPVNVFQGKSLNRWIIKHLAYPSLYEIYTKRIKPKLNTFLCTMTSMVSGHCWSPAFPELKHSAIKQIMWTLCVHWTLDKSSFVLSYVVQFL